MVKIDEFVNIYIPERRQNKILFLTALAWMVASAGVMVLSFALPDMIKEWNLDKLTTSTIISSTFMGMLLGALTSGFICDFVGRKFSSIFYSLVAVTFTVLSGFSNSSYQFLVFRFLSGFGYGGLLPSVNTYLSEFTSINIRGRYLVLLESSWAIGSIIIGLFAVTVAEKISWRWNFWIFFIGYAFVMWFFFEKETPKFIFVKKGEKALKEIFGIEDDIKIDKLHVKKVPFLELFSKNYIKRTFMIWFSWFVVSFVYYALFIWAPRIFADHLGISIVKAKWYTFYMYLAQLPGYLSVAYFIEKLGRKKTLGIYFIGVAISSMLLPFMTSDLSFALMSLVISFFTLGVWGMVYAYTPELFPTPFRGVANGSSGVMARIAGIVAPYFTIFTISYGLAVTFSIIAALALVASIVVFLFGVETKGKEID